MVTLRVEWEARQGFGSPRGSAARREEVSGVAGRERRSFTRTQPALRQFVDATVAPAVPIAEEDAQLLTLEALQGPNSSWPVDTGYSLVGFGWRNVPAGRGTRRWVLTNRAGYAPFVEQRTGAIARTLDALQSTILRGIDLAVQKALR